MKTINKKLRENRKKFKNKGIIFKLKEKDKGIEKLKRLIIKKEKIIY